LIDRFIGAKRIKLAACIDDIRSRPGLVCGTRSVPVPSIDGILHAYHSIGAEVA
jgi:hypothetical protein